MLNKELLRVRVNGNYIKPQFADQEDPALLDLAKSFLEIYQNATGRTREYIENFTMPGAAAFRDIKLARGILKVIQDRADFTVPAERDFALERRETFLRGAEYLRTGTLPETPEEFRNIILPDQRSLYADLPENERLQQVRISFPREVLERDNMSLVQSLLLFTTRLELEIPVQSNPQHLRALLRYLKFFRLLTDAEMKQNTITMIVDGPASIFENSTKYGLQLASFFPAVTRLKQWKAACTVKYKNRELRLVLDQKAPLVCRFSNLSSFQPEEFRMFADYFRKEESRWEINDAPGFLHGEAGKLFFPDFAFRDRETGAITHLELFHRWHLSKLEERLRDCEKGIIRGLIIGVDRSLLKKDGILKQRLENSPYFSSNGFLFRDFPGVRNVTERLTGEMQDIF